MRKAFGTLMVLLVTIPFCLGARKPEPMYLPNPIPLREGVSHADAIESVKQTVMGRGWAYLGKDDSDKGTIVHARLIVRVHMVEITIRVTDELILFEYVDSHGMRYEERKGRAYIHPKYGQWIRNIEADLGALLSKHAE